MGVLGSTAVSMASQATRLGKGSSVTVKGEKETISLAQAKDMILGPNCMLKSLWG